MTTAHDAAPGSADPAADLAEDLALALLLADAADAISLPRFGAGDLRVTEKPDMTPVSDADLAVETALRGILAERRPGDAVVGEEFGAGSEPGTPSERAGRGRAWVIDPIDGTKNFVRGVPVWATLIALLVDGIPQLGVVSAPALARRWWGSPAEGAFTRFADGPQRTCRVSGVRDLEHASLSLAQPVAWEADGRGEAAAALSRRAWRTRGYGDFFPYMLVAEGAVDAAGEPELSLWDLAPLAPIVTAAGGTFSTVDGAAIDASAASALATNGLLHQELEAGLARGRRHSRGDTEEPGDGRHNPREG
jgi:histidinol-phosphatase